MVLCYMEMAWMVMLVVGMLVGQCCKGWGWWESSLTQVWTGPPYSATSAWSYQCVRLGLLEGVQPRWWVLVPATGEKTHLPAGAGLLHLRGC